MLQSGKHSQDLFNAVANISRSSQGFGGYFLPGATEPLIALMSPLMTEAESNATLKPLIDFAMRQKNFTTLSTVTAASYYEIYTSYLKDALEHSSGVAAAQSSRLIPMHNFVGNVSQTTLVNTLADILDSSNTTSTVPIQPLFINIVGPVLYDIPASDLPSGSGYASVTPAWRTSPWHVIYQRLWDPADTTVGGAGSYANAYKLAQDETVGLRALVPDGGSYQNEADINEPDAINMFWGAKNYERLLEIKKAVDPSNVLTVHQGVGWDPKATRFRCYTEL
jgi:hypothetical protein